jgi:predicted aldo/keto reductase-like oxidoreductase
VDLLNFSIYCNIIQNPPKKLLDQVRDIIRLKHYSYRTEETYVQWIVRYILSHDKRHPKDMGVPEIEEFLTHLAVAGNVAAATQNQSFSTQFYFCTAKFYSRN